eukprot:TRINITY_DN120680_c0_g1_i1.p1 TRINITY_DN120680_c0_g1~~TRINITY_DN120680_c0_g1_i1.p1  ORF type:complete len:490 (+),score=134.90 TRINITY_DN120680_c0_g1_i1:165-1472(+)
MATGAAAVMAAATARRVLTRGRPQRQLPGAKFVGASSAQCRPARPQAVAAFQPTVQLRAAASSARPETLHGAKTDENFNVPASVSSKLGANLLLKEKLPLGILWKVMQEYFSSIDADCKFYDREEPIVSTNECFDKLRIPPGHPGRSPSDTYYVNADTVLRTHTSAHQCKHMAEYPNVKSFLCAGDVFRRDEIDASHYPCFHQCEGVRLYDASSVSDEEIQADLKKTLEGLAAHLFNIKIGESTMRWRDDYFPFTEPSFELDIFYNEDWLEVLGCGQIHPEVIQNAGLDPKEVKGWAFGIGLERIAMVLFGIPDIRLFWSEDPRFAQQFDEKSFQNKTSYKPFSKYPPVKKDISMWIPESFVDNDLFEMIRDEGGDQVEKVDLVDEFTNKKTGKTSKLFRVTWRDMSRTLTNEEVNSKHEIVLDRIVKELAVELR